MNILGWMLLALPALALAILMVKMEGWFCLLFVYGGAAVMTAWVILACKLITS